MNKPILIALIIFSSAFAAQADQIPGTKVAYLKNGKRKPAPKPVTPSAEEQLKAQIEDLKKQVADVQDRLKVIETKQTEIATEVTPASAPAPAREASPASAPEPAAIATQATPTTPVQPTELTYEGKHQSFDGSFWVFETAGYTLRCETACPSLKDIDTNEKLVVHAKSGAIDFKTKQQARTCQVSQCAPVAQIAN